MQVHGISSRELKFLERRESTVGEDNELVSTDTKKLKHGERSGLETPVVHALTNESEMLEKKILALKLTHRTFRLKSTVARLKLKGIDGGFLKTVEHVV